MIKTNTSLQARNNKRVALYKLFKKILTIKKGPPIMTALF